MKGYKIINHIFLSLLLYSFAVLCACERKELSGETKADIDLTTDSVIANADISERLLLLSDSILQQLSLEERVGQCFMPAVMSRHEKTNIELIKRYLTDLHVGGLLLMKGDLLSVSEIVGLVRKSEIPLFVAIDAEWGLNMRLEDAPGFPKNGLLGKSADELQLFDYGVEVARESKLMGINMVLGPVIDVVETFGRGAIGRRSFGKDPQRVKRLGISYAMGLEAGGVISVAKHFPGHGSPRSDSHKVLPVVERDFEKLDSIDLVPFKGYIESGLSGIMVGYLAVPALDASGRPAAVSDSIIENFLKDKMGFKGIVLTDALNMGGATGYTALDALEAGADIIVSPKDIFSEMREVIKAVRSGRLAMDKIEDKCRKILYYKLLIEEYEENPVFSTARLKEMLGKEAARIDSLLKN